MIDSGVVRESASSWAAPIVLVKKKDGSWRFCVDYRKLNAVTHKYVFPLPRIEESLTSLKESKWFSTLDLASGYWQVEVDPKDREKTAFTTPLGLYEFDRMPFGLCNAPATFQQLMQSHMLHLEQVFERLWKQGLKLQPRKCSLFQSKVTFLGHVVSKEGVSTDPEKTDAVQRWRAPTTTQEEAAVLMTSAEDESCQPEEGSVSIWSERQENDPALREVCGWFKQGRRPDATARKAALPLSRCLLRHWGRLRLHAGLLQREAHNSSYKSGYGNYASARVAGARDSPAQLTQTACGDRDETPHQAYSYPKEMLRRNVTP
ncbi:hypothetical protein DPEC_G00109820 [Dallia pectoralis]|uniref:Uncharacterized protein n=1 Tax=Dallia pectoralis TaxID=75939 RepID=A0ACC2GSH4_DALPE|nr:hypothetical protein DPEC_G00109820 [Dallia pectoralis]